MPGWASCVAPTLTDLGSSEVPKLLDEAHDRSATLAVQEPRSQPGQFAPAVFRRARGPQPTRCTRPDLATRPATAAEGS